MDIIFCGILSIIWTIPKKIFYEEMFLFFFNEKCIAEGWEGRCFFRGFLNNSPGDLAFIIYNRFAPNHLPGWVSRRIGWRPAWWPKMRESSRCTDSSVGPQCRWTDSFKCFCKLLEQCFLRQMRKPPPDFRQIWSNCTDHFCLLPRILCTLLLMRTEEWVAEWKRITVDVREGKGRRLR